MPKFNKEPEDETLDKQKSIKILSEDEFIINSSKRSFYLTGICFLVSILFNMGIINIVVNQNIYLNILDVFIKSLSIILFFFFLIIAVSNIEEIKGKVLGWKQLTLIIIMSLIQSIRNGWVFLFSSLGIAIIILYLLVLQESR